MNKPLNPSEPKVGDTRIVVKKYADGHFTYFPEVFDSDELFGRPHWTGIPTGFYSKFGYETRLWSSYNTELGAKKIIDTYKERVASTTVVKTEYIKYP